MESIKGYKAFSPGLVCRGKQYAENTTFEEDVTPKACSKGMHFCEEPLAVLDYYPLLDDNCNLTDFAEVESLGETHTDDHKKFATNKLHIGAKLSIRDLVCAEVNFLKEKAGPVSSGYCSKLASSGDGSQLASSGDRSKLASSGDRSQLASSGDGSKLASSGKNSIAAAIGKHSSVMASVGSWIVIAEYAKDGTIITVKTAMIDGERLKPDTWYTLVNGEFKEADD